MSEDDGILQFRPRRICPTDEYRCATYSDKIGVCDHKGKPKVYDEKQRTLECTACGRLIDPLAELIEIVEDWRWRFKPWFEAMQEIRAIRREDDEDFDAWWQRVGCGRTYHTKKVAAREAWRVARSDADRKFEVLISETAEAIATEEK